MLRIRSLPATLAMISGAMALGLTLHFGDLGSVQISAEGGLDYSSFTATSSAASEPGRAAVGLPPLDSAGAAPLQVPLRRVAQPSGADCQVDLSAAPQAGAVVDLLLSAPCLAGERFTIHHSGLMFSALMGPEGRWRGQVPALESSAVFVADFSGRSGAIARAEVGTLRFFDRVVVQWEGEMGLQLHAREYGANYFEPGHVWADTPGRSTDAAGNGTGFLVRLGDTSLPQARVAEVYSFPVGMAEREGTVLLSIEAEVLAETCGKDIEAQTLELRGGGRLRAQELQIALPGCGSVGEYLVLQNMLEDMTIAAR